MIIEKVGGGGCFAPYSLSGAALAVGGVEVDLAAEQQDSEAVVTVVRAGGEIRRGFAAGCELVADVVIPPRSYDVAEEEVEDGEGAVQAQVVRTPRPVDADAVVLRLWPLWSEGTDGMEGQGGGDGD